MKNLSAFPSSFPSALNSLEAPLPSGQEWYYEGVMTAGSFNDESVSFVGYSNGNLLPIFGSVAPADIISPEHGALLGIFYDVNATVFGSKCLFFPVSSEDFIPMLISINGTLYQTNAQNIIPLEESPFVDGEQYNVKLATIGAPPPS